MSEPSSSELVSAIYLDDSPKIPGCSDDGDGFNLALTDDDEP